MITVVLTKEEQRAIKSLQKLARGWPDALTLFSWSGSLVVMKDAEGMNAVVSSIGGIPNDGGDPNVGEDVRCPSEFELVAD